MSPTRTLTRWLLWMSAALLASPGLAQAQNAVLYEVTETMKITGGGSGRREASAALMGTVNVDTPLCPVALAQEFGIQQCAIVANGWNSVDLRTGKGPLSGKFSVVIKGANQNPVDAAEWVIAQGTIKGRIDLSAAVLHNQPLGMLEGTWSAKGDRKGPLAGLRVEGKVWGVFRLPFVLGMPDGCLYADPSTCYHITEPLYWIGPGPADVAYLTPYELSLGVPTVRLDLTFVETARRPTRGDRDEDDD